MEDQKEMKKSSAVDRVVNELIDRIVRGDLKPGSKIPTEPELATECSVGRNSVREAIKQLEAFGVLYIKKADGTYIADNYNPKMLDPMVYSLILKEHDWNDFVQLRAVIDIGTLHMALRSRGTQEIVPRLKEVLSEMKEEMEKALPDLDQILELDLSFHSMISDTLHNPQLKVVNDYITRLSIPSRRKSIERWVSDHRVAFFLDLHSQIVDVIEKREVQRIEQVISAHYIYWYDINSL